MPMPRSSATAPPMPGHARTAFTSTRTGRGGVGKALLEDLCEKAEEFGFRQMIAVIGGAEPASIALHASCGFREVGRLHAAGWKHGRWLDNVYMQRALGAGSSGPPEA